MDRSEAGNYEDVSKSNLFEGQCQLSTTKISFKKNVERL